MVETPSAAWRAYVIGGTRRLTNTRGKLNFRGA